MRALKKLMRSKEEVRRRLSRDRRGALGDNLREAIASGATRAAAGVAIVYERRGDMCLRREFVERRRSFSVAKTTTQPASIRELRLINEDISNWHFHLNSKKTAIQNNLKPVGSTRTYSFKNKIARFKKNSLFTSSMTSNTILYENRGKHKVNDDDETINKNFNSLHLSMPKLNFDMKPLIRTRSESNLYGGSRRRRRGGDGREQKYKIIFERKIINNESSSGSSRRRRRTTRSNSCLVESSSFEASRYRLMRTREIQAALEGIESEMDKLLANTRGNTTTTQKIKVMVMISSSSHFMYQNILS